MEETINCTAEEEKKEHPISLDEILVDVDDEKKQKILMDHFWDYVSRFEDVYSEESILYNNDNISYNVEQFMEDMDEVCTCVQTYGILEDRMNSEFMFELLASDDEEFEQLLKCFKIEDGEYKARWDFAKPYEQDFNWFIDCVKESMLDDTFNYDVEDYDEMFDVFRCNYEFFHNEIVNRPEELENDFGGLENIYYRRIV